MKSRLLGVLPERRRDCVGDRLDEGGQHASTWPAEVDTRGRLQVPTAPVAAYGSLVYVEVQPVVYQPLRKGETVALVEMLGATGSISSPVTGRVLEVNDWIDLEDGSPPWLVRVAGVPEEGPTAQ
jgi:hypothetical protein